MRIDAMLKELVVEKALEAIISDNDEPTGMSRTEIAEFVGCSRETIRRIEKNALSKMKKHWA
jgi:DNA-directed RNA polymerase sigma subunit (sigma70/sigma32)